MRVNIQLLHNLPIFYIRVYITNGLVWDLPELCKWHSAFTVLQSMHCLGSVKKLSFLQIPCNSAVAERCAVM